MSRFFSFKKNNQEVTLDPFKKPDDNGKNKAGDPPPPNPNGNGDPATAKKAARDALAAGLKRNGIYEGIDIKAFVSAVQSGNEEEVSGVLAQIIQNTAITTLQMSQQLMQSELATVTQKASETAASSTARRLAEDALFEKLPFLRDAAPMHKPAKDALHGFLDQGMDVQEAIDSTVKYFNGIAQTVAPHFGLQPKASQDGRTHLSRSTSGMPDNNHNTDDEEKEDDWISALTGGNRSFEDLVPTKPNNGGDGA